MDRFDVIAKVPADSTVETQKLMLQALLQDRFKLVVHKGTRQLPTYALTVGKKVQLKEADGSGDTGCKRFASGSGSAGRRRPQTDADQPRPRRRDNDLARARHDGSISVPQHDHGRICGRAARDAGSVCRSESGIGRNRPEGQMEFRRQMVDGDVRTNAGSPATGSPSLTRSKSNSG